jgi:hypothetical protein
MTALTVVHHNVHTSELRPDLGEDTDVEAIEHLRLEELLDGDVGVLPLELNHLLDLGHLEGDERRVGVTLAVDEGENLVALLPAVVTGEPPWGFG